MFVEEDVKVFEERKFNGKGLSKRARGWLMFR
jgi:hypothetical protein